MRRTDQEFKEEVLRRSSAYRAKRKQVRKKVLTTALCFALVIFGIHMVMPMLSMGSSTEAAVNDAMEAPQSPGAAAPFADKSVPMEAEPESVEEEYVMADSSMTMASATGVSQSMPEDFSIRFIWGIVADNIFDTGKGEIQKDLVNAGVATAKFDPSEEMMMEIYNQICLLEITSIEQPMTAHNLKARGSDLNYALEPLTTYEITITMNETNYLIVGDETAKFFQEEEDAVRFVEFVEYLKQLVKTLPEYQALPEAEGAYE
ncbi:MAG: hypothetical protein IKJ99_01675 [Oscillospiraceae bacterium]|nr:hypothetical protein [Oscillospiraceae bacterium]